MRELTLSEIESSSAAIAAEESFHMDEQTFRAFYEKTARPLWSYLSRILGDATLAEDLAQESYYRFLRARLKSRDESHQKHYLFRIATNLARDYWRAAPRKEMLNLEGTEDVSKDDGIAERAQQSSDLARAMKRLKPRERELLWLAYVEGSSHKEIAGVVGLRAASIRLLLFRARRKMAHALRQLAKPSAGKKL